jgi:hypothetical protein
MLSPVLGKNPSAQFDPSEPTRPIEIRKKSELDQYWSALVVMVTEVT